MEDNKKYWYWLAQFGGWGFYFILVILSAYNNETLDYQTSLFILVLYVSFIGFTHLMRFCIIRFGLLNISFWKLLPRAILLCLVTALTMVGFQLSLEYLFHELDPNFEVEPITFINTLLFVMTRTIILVLWSTVYFTYHFFQKSRNEEIKNLQLEATRNEIELNNLKSQLNPHFMFNALNSIRALIDESPTDAKLAVTKLSNTLRNSLKMGKDNRVSVKDELDLILNYSDIEKIRFEERLSVKTNVDERLLEFEIPPLMIQTLVENAIKHGISKRMKGGEVLIEIQQQEKDLVIKVQNSGTITQKNTESGIGLTNTRKRIALTYGEESSLKLYDDIPEETTTAEIRIKDFKKFNVS